MRIALLSDIHANLPALEAALHDVRRESPDAIYVCGDSIGYYFWPKEVLELLESVGAASIKGNHEEMLVQMHRGAISSDSVREKYGPGLDIALADLNAHQLATIEQLPHPLTISSADGDALISHGSPENIDRYVYPDSKLDFVNGSDFSRNRWIVMGHTHYPMEAVKDDILFINPGSVGQPRNRVPGAHWALLNTEKDDVTFFNTQYDHRAVANEARRRCPELPYLERVLVRT